MKKYSSADHPDPLDRMLSNLPEEPIPADLAARIYANVLAHHKRHVAFHFGISVVLAATGIWLALPGLVAMLQGLATLPDSGWQLISAWIEMAGTGAARMVADLLSSVTAYQAQFSNPFGGLAWVGMIVLAGGCLLALDQMLPHNAA